MQQFIAFVLLLACAALPALASPGYYLVSAYDKAGEATIDFKFWSFKSPEYPAVFAPEIGFGYGVTSRWYTELTLSWLDLADSGTRSDGLLWQNDYLLTQGQYPFDLALHTNIKKYYDGAPRAASAYFGNAHSYELEFGPVLQTELGRTQFNANMFFTRSYRTTVASPMQAVYQWQIKHRWRPAFAFGLQGFGELGKWDHWAPRSEQSHRIGPAIFSSLPMAGGRAMTIEAAFLTGSLYAEHGQTFTMRAQYAF